MYKIYTALAYCAASALRGRSTRWRRFGLLNAPRAAYAALKSLSALFDCLYPYRACRKSSREALIRC